MENIIACSTIPVDIATERTQVYKIGNLKPPRVGRIAQSEIGRVKKYMQV